MCGDDDSIPVAGGDGEAEQLREIKLVVTDELYRAWQRCSWVLVNETGRSRTDIMREMVLDFLIKHGC